MPTGALESTLQQHTREHTQEHLREDAREHTREHIQEHTRRHTPGAHPKAHSRSTRESTRRRRQGHDCGTLAPHAPGRTHPQLLPCSHALDAIHDPDPSLCPHPLRSATLARQYDPSLFATLFTERHMWESYRDKHNLTTTAPFASIVFFDQIMAEPNKTYTVKQNFQMGQSAPSPQPPPSAYFSCIMRIRQASLRKRVVRMPP